MQEIIRLVSQRMTERKGIAAGILVGVVLVSGIGFSMKEGPAAGKGGRNVTANNPSVGATVVVAGATSSWDNAAVGNSWPGELLSLANVPVQPVREGTIAEWRVHVGERVTAGEILGTLSAPPQTPDSLAMLANEEKMVTMARVTAEAKHAYVVERLPQLAALRTNTERSLSSSEKILGGVAASSSALAMVDAKKAAIRALLRNSLVNAYPILSGQPMLPLSWGAITLKSAIGAQNSRLRNDFPETVSAVLTDLEEPDSTSITSGLAYFDLAIRLADTSLADGAALTDAELFLLKDMLHKDRDAFIMAVDKLRETELLVVNTNKESFEQLRAIDNEIAMLKQELAMVEGDLAAKEASLRTIKNSVAGKAEIIAPRKGTVSVIMKNVGEYVLPGMPVAIVTGGGANDLVVRFRIPINAGKPSVGDLLSVVRTGFPDAPRTAKLIGIGSAVDEGGALMADAVLTDTSDWPVGTAIRILEPSQEAGVAVKLSSLWWDADGNPHLWAVSPAGRVYAKKVSLGRTVGESVEVVDGLLRGDRYLEKPSPGIADDMLVDDIATPQKKEEGNSSYEEAMRAMGM